MNSTLFTVLEAPLTCGLGEFRIDHPPGTFAPTPASLIAVEAVARHRERLHGTGLDWGSGTGCLAIVAARIPAVTIVIGLEIVAANVETAARNAEVNGVAEKVRFLHADSYEPYAARDCTVLNELAGRVDFILANPPSSSPHADGFKFRRAVLRGALRFLVPGGVVFLSVSEQYGRARLYGLCSDVPGFRYGGLLATTDLVPFDMRRPDLLLDVDTYAREEERGGFAYAFTDPAQSDRPMTASQALAHFQKTGTSPLSRWQSHLFTRDGP